MAVSGGQSSEGRRVVVGINVGLMIVLAVALVAGLQWIGYAYSTNATRLDLTSSGVNSLSDGTVKLLAGLDRNVRITSTYFTTDLEDEDQARYRATVDDLIDLYRVSNRSKIVTETINPLQDHEKRKAMVDRLARMERFDKQAESYREVINTFQDAVAPEIGELVGGELARLEAFGALADTDARLISQVRQLCERIQQDMVITSREITDAQASETPAYGAATTIIRQVYTQVTQMLTSIGDVGTQVAASPGQLSPPVEEFFSGAAERYQPLLDDLKQHQEKLGTLPQLELEDILRQLGPMANAVLVETDKDARIVDFRSMWPASDPNNSRAAFKDRRFAGEQKLTAAILQLTQEQQPAVVFVRFGGTPLLMGGFMPGQPPAPYAQMKGFLEDVNFSVHEWDLSTQEEMPGIDPEPSRVIFVVFPPVQPPPTQMGQPPQQPPFTDADLAKLTSAMGQNGRALFLAGYSMGQFGMAAPYAYNEYLKENWGLELVADRLLLRAARVGPEKYQFQQAPILLDHVEFSNHPVVESLGRMRCILPFACPVTLHSPAPEGVTVERLAWIPRTEGLWAIKDVNYYVQQQGNEFIVRGEEDHEGEFTVAAAASSGDAKIIFVSSAEFATDRTALATEMVLTSRGLSFRERNPGNVAWFINSLHWLNDNTEWMDLGTPVDESTLAVESNSTAMSFVRVLAWFIWPGVAFVSGVIVWWVRRS